ncbi:phage tail tape measure protein [Lactiplantibacillus plantarum]
MAKVQNEMATRITIDSIGAVKSYKALTDAVKASMNAWKASEVQLKSAGNYQEAAKAKVEGLTKSIDLQKGKLGELKARQQDIDKSTKEGQEAYFKLENQIANATKQLGNYEGQLKRAKSSSTYYTSGLAELQKGYKQSTNASKAYTDRLEAEGKQAEAGKAKLAGLKQSYANLYAQLKLQKDELTKVASESGLTSEKYAKQRVRVEETTTAMAKQKSEVASLTVKYGTMSDKMVKLSDKAALVKDKFRTVASGFKSVATAASIGIAGVTAASVAGAKKASTLQNIYKQNQNLLVTSGDSAKSAIKAVTEMQKDGQQYSVKYGLSQKEIAEQYQDLIKRGHTAKESLAVMKTELQASVASGDDFQDVVKVSSQVLEAFGMKTNNTAKMMASTKRVVNDLAYSADVTATDFHSLGKGMEYVGDSANNAGFSVEETSAALGELSNHGLEADKAGTGLRKTINSLADPSDAATGALKKIGITSTKVFQKSNGDFKSMSDIMAIMEKHTKNLGGAEKAAVFKAIFGATGMQAAQILAVNNKELASLTNQVTKAGKEGDYVQKLANKNSSTAQMNVKRFKEAAEALEIMMGAKLLPTMTEAADDMTKAFNNKSTQKGLTFLINNVKNLLNGMLKVVEFMGSHTKTVTAFGVALGGVWALAKVNKFIKLIKEMRANFGLVNDTVKSQSIVKTVEAETDALESQNKVLETNKDLSSESSLGSVTGSSEKLEKEASEVGEVAQATETATTKTTLWGSALTKVKGGWSKLAPLAMDAVSKIITVAGAALSAWDLGKSVVKAINKPTTTNKIKIASKTIGAVIGGTLGSFGGPWGTVIGATIGEQLGSTKTSNKIVAGLEKSLKRAQTYYKDHKTVVNADGTTTVKLTVAGEAKQQIAALKKTFNSLPTATKSAVKKANGEFKKLNAGRLKLSVGLNETSLKQSSKKIINAVNSLYKEVESKAKSHASSASKEAQKLYKAGLINKSDLKKTEKIIQSHYTSTTKSAKSAAQKIKEITKSETSDLEENTKERGKAINKVESQYSAKRASIATEEKSNIAKIKHGQTVTLDGIEYSGQKGINNIQKSYSAKRKKINSDEGKAINAKSESYSKTRKGIYSAYAKSYVKQEEKLGSSISKTLTSSSKKQEAIMSELKNAKGKISKATAEKLIDDSYQTAKKTIKYAEDEYTEKVAKAKATKKSLIDYAEDTYTGKSAYAVKMRKKITDEANTQYKNSVSAAKQTETKTEAHAASQEKTIVDTAKKQSKGVTAHAVKQGNNTIEASGKGASGSAEIFSGLLKWLGKIKWLTGVNESSATFNPNVYKISGMTYARGTGNGTVGKSGLALVGEQGPELAYNANKGVFRILGANGAEVSKVDGHESILNAKDTAKVLSGGYGKDKVLPGFASGTSTLSNFFKSITKNATKLYKSLSKTVKTALKHPIKTVESLLKGITDIKVPNEGFVSNKTWEKGYDGAGKIILKDAKNLFKKISTVVSDATGDAGGTLSNPTGSSVTRWKPYVIKALKANGFAATASQVSAWMRVISRESNGNPKAINLWDSNAKAGHPSMGLVQTIRSTFDAYKFSGHGQIYNGYDDLLAGINYMKHIYGKSASAFARVSGSEGYENGGIINTNQLIEVAEKNKPEMVLPLTNKSRANQLITQANQIVNGNDTSTQVASTSSESNEKLDKLINLMSAILANMGDVQAVISKSDVVNAVKSDNKTASQYSQMMGY